MANFAVWFDIPVKNMERAIEFYSKVFEIELTMMEGAPKKYAVFPYSDGSVSGGLVEDGDKVVDKGSLLYLNGGEDLSKPLNRVKDAGGSVLQEKTSIGPNGFMAIILDSEGNRIALHSMK
ncbi:VOC family protein [Leptospira fluminis]|uniref:VOC family protein n=1 Tax=Leptospira fluminis TaxID=2484979 RepID=A0A4R9GLH1_9LEPT|nr:VOC family protein [Leptospira fluminis]TGK15250.1 VOC family protein [Leptospira fluminis]